MRTAFGKIEYIEIIMPKYIVYTLDDFNTYASKLRRTTDLAARYILDDPGVKARYRKEINDVIEDIRRDYNNSQGNIEKKRELVREIKYEYESEEEAYQQARRLDYGKYKLTELFEDTGVIKYAKTTGKILGGVVQIVGGHYVFKVGKALGPAGTYLNMKRIGMLAMATGVSNTVEAISPIVYEYSNGKYNLGNPLKDLTEYAFVSLGANEGMGEFSYDIVDFGVSSYLTFGSYRRINASRRLLNSWIDGNSSNRLFRAIRQDYKRKWETMNKPMFFLQGANTIRKFNLIISKDEEK
ncbi:hypothetical protein Xmir_03917 [Xenorhabdus miraniensis]|uniref:DUF4225 domain-containing protein n=2 Tax=Xenorhabdus miraniensis TaxID=351674 RepID=A0A2D0JKI5_9GAMM|nr:hypothetical protein Xmir_03917 [Xenorhabdus miraniensis]